MQFMTFVIPERFRILHSMGIGRLEYSGKYLWEANYYLAHQATHNCEKLALANYRVPPGLFGQAKSISNFCFRTIGRILVQDVFPLIRVAETLHLQVFLHL